MELTTVLKKNVNLNLSENQSLLREILHQQLTEVVNSYLLSYKIEKEIIFVVEPPTEESYGDYATNVALVLAGFLKKSPLDIAQEISTKLDLPNLLDKIEVKAPGFINLTIKQDYFIEELKKILSQKNSYGTFCNLNPREPEKIMVEFGQPNTHKFFTVGHIKGTITGLAVCRLLKNLGYAVIQTNYYGDIGMHTAKSVWGLMQKGVPKDFELWDKHKKMEYIAEAYVFANDNFDANEIAIRKINTAIYRGLKNEVTTLYEKIKVWSLEHQQAIFADLGVVYDKQYPESQMVALAKKIVAENKPAVFQESQGAVIYDGEKVGLTTWVMQTSEGNPTYSAKDLALGFQKFKDYPDLYLNLTLTGVEQQDYFEAIIKILETLDKKFHNRYYHLSFGWLLKDGKKTSSRSGKNIKGTDILAEALVIAKTKIAELKDYDEEKREEISRVVALAGLKFLILSHEFSQNINYDPEKFVNFEGYSGPYILYAYVRAQTILKKGQETGKLTKEISENYKLNEFENSLLRWMTRYPQMSFRAGIEIAPHLICVYLFELAQRFNSFYAHCPVLELASPEEKNFRFVLVAGASQVLKNGLNLLGIETIEEM